MAQAQRQKSKKRKKPDNRPARARYWHSNRLKEHKVAHLMRYNGFETKAKAFDYWYKARQRHKDMSYSPKTLLSKIS